MALYNGSGTLNKITKSLKIVLTVHHYHPALRIVLLIVVKWNYQDTQTIVSAQWSDHFNAMNDSFKTTNVRFKTTNDHFKTTNDHFKTTNNRFKTTNGAIV